MNQLLTNVSFIFLGRLSLSKPQNSFANISFRQFKMIGFESTKSKRELFLEPPGEKSQMKEEITISCRIFYWCNDITILQLSIWPYTLETKSAKQVRKQYLSIHFRWRELSRLNRNPQLFLEPRGEKSQVIEEIIISCRIFYWCNDITTLQLSIWPYMYHQN